MISYKEAQMEYYFLITLIAMISGFFSGLLGLGGGIIIIPAFLYILPLLGYETLSLKQITGVSAMQSLLGSTSALIAHLKFKLIEKRIYLKLVIFTSIGSAFGSIASHYLPEKVLLVLFATLLSLSSILIFIPQDSFGKTSVNKRWAPVVLSGIIGIICGALGIGGAILFIPILHYFYNLSMKACISNATILVVSTSIFSVAGKTLTNQVPFKYLPFIIIGAFLGAKIGANVSQKTKPSILKIVLFSIISATLIRVVLSILN